MNDIFQHFYYMTLSAEQFKCVETRDFGLRPTNHVRELPKTLFPQAPQVGNIKVS